MVLKLFRRTWMNYAIPRLVAPAELKQLRRELLTFKRRTISEEMRELIEVWPDLVHKLQPNMWKIGDVQPVKVLGADGYPYGFNITTEVGKPIASFAYTTRLLLLRASSSLPARFQSFLQSSVKRADAALPRPSIIEEAPEHP